jgi:DNA-binding NtrC family response regulator
VRHLLQEALSLRGYRVVTAVTVAEAEAHLQGQNAGAIGLVVTDVHLTADPQGEDGYALYQRWSIVPPTLHFLVISGRLGCGMGFP